MRMEDAGHLIVDYRSLEPRYRKLLAEARAVAGTGYNPYTGTKVGAAVLTDRGQTISASNVVPEARSANLCAERAAIAKANSMGRRRFVAIAIFGRPARRKPQAYMYTPCGTCRQLIHEFAKTSGRDIDVLMSNGGMTKAMAIPISRLLPFAFQ